MDKPRRALVPLDVIALALLVLETLTAVAIAVGYVIYGLLDDELSSLGGAIAAVVAVMAAGLAVFTWGFAQRKRFALGGVVTWQLMQLSVGVSVFPAAPAVAVALLVAAMVVMWAVVRRQSGLRALHEPEPHRSPSSDAAE